MLYVVNGSPQPQPQCWGFRWCYLFFILFRCQWFENENSTCQDPLRGTTLNPWYPLRFCLFGHDAEDPPGAKQLVHWFLGGRLVCPNLNPCLQEISVRVVSPQPKGLGIQQGTSVLSWSAQIQETLLGHGAKRIQRGRWIVLKSLDPIRGMEECHQH